MAPHLLSSYIYNICMKYHREAMFYFSGCRSIDSYNQITSKELLKVQTGRPCEEDEDDDDNPVFQLEEKFNPK